MLHSDTASQIASDLILCILQMIPSFVTGATVEAKGHTALSLNSIQSFSFKAVSTAALIHSTKPPACCQACHRRQLTDSAPNCTVMKEQSSARALRLLFTSAVSSAQGCALAVPE